jgi:hypothetical protein
MVADVTTNEQTKPTAFTVIDALDHPHGGRILRVRLLKGDPPTLRQLRGARLRAEGPDGEKTEVEVLGFTLLGGKISDRRLRKTGRVDLHVRETAAGPPVSLRWRLSPA